jgi:hypothetical protein
MLKKTIFVASLVATLLLLPQFASAQLSASRPPSLKGTTMDFVNVTGARINQTVPELNGNEKEVEVGDFDNDGDPDVVLAVALSDFTDRRNKLYRNDAGVFNEVSGAPIISTFSNLDVTRNMFLRDYDDDGWLDIIVVNDANNGSVGGTTRFLHNIHPGGVFSHFAEETSRLNGAGGAACSAISADLDNQNGDDLYMGNYPFNSQDTMYLNDGSGNFTSVTNSMVPTEQDYTVDVSAADLNGDGKIDLIVTSSFGDPSYIIYNDLNDAGSGPGDFKYSGSRVNIGLTNQENSAEPADFNNDGRIDIYFANKGNNTDRVWKNTGIAGDGKANFSEISLTGFYVSSSSSRKATVADLNKDGRIDVIVMGEGRRPSILRNTSVNGDISFVEWTPGDAFPNGSSLSGWHAGAFDSNADGRIDIFVGGNSNDHLFENVPSPTIKEGVAAGSIPAIHNSSPIAILGNGMVGDRDVYSGANIPTNGKVSVVLKSSSNVTLEVRNSSGSVIASSERGGNGIEEALHFSAPSGGFTIEVVIAGAPKGSSPMRSYILEVLSRS